MEIPIAALMEELGEESVITHLLNNKATVRWTPTLTQPLDSNQHNKELPQPTLVETPQEPARPMEPVVPQEPVVLEKAVELVEPARLDDLVQPRTPSTSDLPVLTEKQKALAKLTALVPRANASALSTIKLTSEEYLRYKSTVPRVFKFLNQCPEEGVSAECPGISFCQPDTFMADTGADIMLVTQEFCENMGLGVGPTKMGIQTSVSGLGDLNE